ncbi:hypothetical protein AV530_007634 [Patagioenas fasciata monilis]|uniref:Uncharacterized protein n=1 Tax=Patagioenas fasciata monilis TaxID=372326 RepID=A0A1V4K054_PATFA|nr:hypothetical protein AV530_007634 [Patagioenas fasciata monilis]
MYVVVHHYLWCSAIVRKSRKCLLAFIFIVLLSLKLIIFHRKLLKSSTPSSEYNSNGWFPGSLETGYFFGITLLNRRMHLS